VVHDTLFETTVTICIILNTAFLAIEHHGMSQELDETLETGNKVIVVDLKVHVKNLNEIVVCSTKTSSSFIHKIP
jgi:hypothetical protein